MKHATACTDASSNVVYNLGTDKSSSFTPADLITAGLVDVTVPVTLTPGPGIAYTNYIDLYPTLPLSISANGETLTYVMTAGTLTKNDGTTEDVADGETHTASWASVYNAWVDPNVLTNGYAIIAGDVTDETISFKEIGVTDPATFAHVVGVTFSVGKLKSREACDAFAAQKEAELAKIFAERTCEPAKNCVLDDSDVYSHPCNEELVSQGGVEKFVYSCEI